VPLIAESVMDELSETVGTDRPILSASARRKLHSHAWPGNVRELRNVLARAMILTTGPRIGSAAVELDEASQKRPQRRSKAGPSFQVIDFQVAKGRWIQGFLEAALRQTEGNVTAAAKLTGMKRQAMSRLLSNHGIDSRQFKAKDD
ncbi:MAG: AAA-type ATPase lid domain-containing protein, partial [Planctomycetota bacterium]